MANSPQAIKRARQSEKRRLSNVSEKSSMRTAIKKTLREITQNNKDTAKDAFQQATVSIDRLTGKGLIHPNKGARLKSRLNNKLKNLAK